jgi:hypothetical protein
MPTNQLAETLLLMLQRQGISAFSLLTIKLICVSTFRLKLKKGRGENRICQVRTVELALKVSSINTVGP